MVPVLDSDEQPDFADTLDQPEPEDQDYPSDEPPDEEPTDGESTEAADEGEDTAAEGQGRDSGGTEADDGTEGTEADGSEEVAPRPSGPAPPKAPPVVPKPLVPAGTPVAKAITVNPAWYPSIAPTVQETVKTIDSVHGDGTLPQIQVDSLIPPGYQGALSVSADGTPLSMHVNPAAETPMITVAHETGHLLDYGGIPGEITTAAGRDFRADPQFADLLKATDGSEAIQALQALKGEATIPIDTASGSTIPYTVDQKMVEYLLQDNETWARAYSQYIATRSEDPTMLDELTTMQQSKYNQVYPQQWSDADFAPIGKAIDSLFKDLGWLK